MSDETKKTKIEVTHQTDDTSENEVKVGSRSMLKLPKLPTEQAAATDDTKEPVPTSPSKSSVTVQPLGAPELAAVETKPVKTTKKAIKPKAVPVLDKADTAESTTEPPQAPETVAEAAKTETEQAEASADAAKPVSPDEQLSKSDVPIKDPLVETAKPAAPSAEPVAKADDTVSATTETDADKAAASVQPAEPATSEPAPAASTDKQTADEPEATDSIDDAADAKKDPGNEETIDAEAAERQAHEKAVQKLVDSGTYVLPIKTVEQRRSQHVIILGVLLSLLLVAAWADIALDAGLIHIHGVHALTHFFST